MDSDYDSSGSDYLVEDFVVPKKTRKPVNDDSADLLGNFDDEKRKEIFAGTYKDEEKSEEESSEEEEVKDYNGSEDDTEMNGDGGSDEEDYDPTAINTKLSKEQIQVLQRGASKTNRYVVYVTNLNFETQKEELEGLFMQAGEIKGIRIPTKRRGGFAFVEMATLEGFQKAFEFHNIELQGRNIKVQISEGGKKKSANKKNIMKQKNRKLAEMRNEPKAFNKSGKTYDKKIKKVKAKEFEARKRWRKPNNSKPRP